MKILITGASGFVGLHLAQELIARRHKVYLFDIRKSDGIPRGRFMKGDIRDLKGVLSASSKVDGIIHLAAVSRVNLARESPRYCIDVNVMGTLNFLEGARLLKRNPWLIIASSREVDFNWSTGYLKIKKMKNLYGISKFISELLCFQYARNYKLRVLILRFSDIYGSLYDNQDKVLPKIILEALSNENIEICDPAKKFDFIHYKDVIRGVYLGIRYISKIASGPFFREVSLCTGQPTSLRQLVRLIIKKTNSASQVKYCKILSKNKRSDINTVATRTALGFKAQIPLSQGIELTMKSFRDNFRKN